MLTCQSASCEFSNDDGARFCAGCGRRLAKARPGSVQLLGGQRIESALDAATRPNVPGLDAGRAAPLHAGRAAGQSYLFLADGRRCQLYELHAAFGEATELVSVSGSWPAPSDWLSPPLYTPLAVAVGAPERVVWHRTRRKLPSGPVQEAAARNGERFLGLGLVDEVWIVAARRLDSATLAFEATSGESGELHRLATLHGQIPEDAAVLLGSTHWLADVAEAGDPADSHFELERHPDTRPPVRHLWALVGTRLLVLDIQADRVCADVAIGQSPQPTTYRSRRAASLIEPTALPGNPGGLYLSAPGPEGSSPVFLAARPPLKPTPLAPPAHQGAGDWSRLADLVPRPNGDGVLFVTPSALTPYRGTQAGDPISNPLSKNIMPLVGPGFLAMFSEPSLGFSDESAGRLLIYRAAGEGRTLNRHVDAAVPQMPVRQALPPLFTGDSLQLIGHTDEDLRILVVPIAGTAKQ